MSLPPKRPAAPVPERGFTLLEVLVALAILGTAVVLSIQGVSQGLRLLKVAGDQQQAIIVADQKAREMLIPVEGTDSGADGRFSWERTSRVLETPELTPVEAAPEWRVFQISVVVTWEQRRLEVSTLRTVPATSDPTRATEVITRTVGGGESPGSPGPSGRPSGSAGSSGSTRSSGGAGSSGITGSSGSGRSVVNRPQGGGS